MRSLEDLIDTDDPGFDLLRKWSGEPHANPHVVLPVHTPTREGALLNLQVTTRSLLGAVVWETGGLLVDRGRLRVFGSGETRSIASVNVAAGAWKADELGDVLFVADDIMGGLFALNGGRFGDDGPGDVFHLAGDATRWVSLGVGYGDFIHWCLTQDLSAICDFDTNEAYGSARHVGGLGEVNAFYPWFWTRDGRGGKADARVVPADENLRLRLDLLGYVVDDNTGSVTRRDEA